MKFITDPLKESFIDVISVEKRRKIRNIELFYGKVKVKTTVIGYSVRDFENEEKLQDFLFERGESLTREFETESFWFTIPEEWEDEIIRRNIRHNLRLLHRFLKEKEKLYTGGSVYTQIVRENVQRFLKGDRDALSLLFTAADVIAGKLSEKEKEEYKEIKKRINERKNAFIGGLHGVEHAMIGIYPLFAMNDRWDIGGLSTNFYSDFGKPTIFIYDGYEGGVGYSKVGFNRLKDIMESTYKNISRCRCISGCPSCIYSPKCGNSNEYLDKTAAIILSHKILKEVKM